MPDSLERFYCNSDSFTKELDKSNCSKDDYYILSKFKEHRNNNLTSWAIPVERLFVIRSNLKQFINKWDKKNKKKLSELSKLQSPEELDRSLLTSRWTIYTTQFIGRGAAVAGSILTFQDYGAVGGGILGIYPITELIASKLEEGLKIKESKWKEFLNDADTLLDNYHELLAILTKFETVMFDRGGIKKAFSNLDKEVKVFLAEYDKADAETGEKNEEIEIEELIEKRKELIKDISKNPKAITKGKLWKIVDAIKELEGKVTDYRRGKLIDEEVNLIELVKEKQEVLETKIEISTKP